MIVCKYKFDSSIYSNLIPEFNSGYNGYTVSDEVNGNIVTRTIECDTLPTRIVFGHNTSGLTVTRDAAASLLEVSNINANVTDASCMFSNCSNLTSLDLNNFDTSNATSISYMFYGCNNLTSLDVSNWDTSKVTNMNYMFYGCNNLTSLDVSNWNTSKATAINNMFQNCNNLTSLDVSNWDTSKVTNMASMFNNCQSLASLDVSNWNTSKVTNMQDMFNFCYSLKNVDVSNWDTSNTQYINGMFGRCRQMTTINIGNFNMSAIKTTDVNSYLHMFVEIPNVKTLIFGNNKFPDNINFDTLFGGIQPSSLEKVIVLEEDTMNKLTYILPDRSTVPNPGIIVTNTTISDEVMNTISSKNWSIRKMVAQYRFDANNYEDLMPEFNTEFSSDKYEVYDSVSEIVIDDIKWTVANNAQHKSGFIPVLPNVIYIPDRPMDAHWYDSDKQLISQSLWSGKIKPIESPINAKYVCLGQNITYGGCILSAKLITRSIESKNGDLPTLMRFGQAWTSGEVQQDYTRCLLEVLDMNTSELTSCHSMFRYCTNLTSINCNWNTSKVTNMNSMFNVCPNLTQLDVSNFDTSKVTTMYCMFHNCPNLAQLNVSNFDTSNVASMYCMFYNCTNLTSLNVSNFDTSNVTSMYCMFYNCTNLTSLDLSNFNTSNVTSMHCMFYNCKNLTQLNVSNFDTSNVTDMNGMFHSCSNLTQLNVSNFDTSNVTDMNSMFYNCSNLTSLDVSNFNTSKVTNMRSMFNACTKLAQLDVSNFNTSNVTDMYCMFTSCNKLIQLDVSNFNTSKVTTMYCMFYNCKNLTQLDVSNFDTSKVTTMQGMFSNCINLTQLDVSNFDTSKVTTMSYMFNNCTKLTQLDLSNFDTNKVTNMSYMFNYCSNLTSLDISNFNVVNVTDFTDFLVNTKIKLIKCLNPSTINTLIQYLPDKSSASNGVIIIDNRDNLNTNELTSKNWVTINANDEYIVTEYKYDKSIYFDFIPAFNIEFDSYFIYNEYNDEDDNIVTRKIVSNTLPILMRFGSSDGSGGGDYTRESSLLEVMKLTTDNLNDMSLMFYRCNNLTQLDVSNFNTSKVNNMYGMFSVCNNLTSLDLSNFDTSSVVNMSLMFNSCKNLTQLDVSNFNTSKVNNMYAMFHNCNNLTQLDVSNFNTSQVTNMQSMFNGCTKLAQLDVSNFNTSKVTTMEGMFYYCPNLTQLDVSNFNTSEVTNMYTMFYGCTNLTQLDLSNFDTSKVTTMHCMFYNCNNLTQLDVSNFDTSKVTNMDYMFTNCNNLLNIGMLYCTHNTINTITSVLPNNVNITIYYLDEDINFLNIYDYIEYKEYKESSYTLQLNSPLYEGDKIVVKDDKLCHYHKMGMIVLDGSEDEGLWKNNTYENTIAFGITIQDSLGNNCKVISDTMPTINTVYSTYGLKFSNTTQSLLLVISKSKLSTQDVNGFKQWLQANPITVIYELAEPYYEDITPIQSQWVMSIFEESNLDIITSLPIKSNISYSVSILDTNSLEEELNEVITNKTDLTNLLEDEINN